MVRSAIIVATVAAVLATACGGGSDEGPNGPEAASELTVGLKEFRFDPRKLEAAAGEVSFELSNTGKLEHTFVIIDPADKKVAGTKPIKPKKTATLRVELQPGTYKVVCTQPGHKPAGMSAKLEVK